MKARLGGEPEQAPAVPCVGVAHVEAVVAAWTGIPVERMTQDDRERLVRMEPALKVRAGACCRVIELLAEILKKVWLHDRR